MNVNVLQWNVWMDEDIHNVVELIGAHDADIVCLQELTIDSPKQSVADTAAYIAQQLSYNYYAAEVPIESTTGEKVMLANGIFSKFPIIEKWFAWTAEPNQGGGYNDEYRAYAEVTLGTDTGPLSVGTTHMSYTHAFGPNPRKAAETDALLKQISGHTKRFILSGDLNAIPNSYTIRKLADLLIDAGPDYGQKTWTTKPFSYNGFEATELDYRLDYVFTTPDVVAQSSEIIGTNYSDHLPLLARFKI